MAKKKTTRKDKAAEAAPAAPTDLDYADKLWKAADTLRGQVDAAEYKHVVLGLLFLKYISDAFAARRDELAAELTADGIPEAQHAALLESRDEYAAENVFWVPKAARWEELQAQATSPKIATLIDDAVLAVEADNPSLKNKLPRDYARRGIEPIKLKSLVDLVADIGFKGGRDKARDTLGRVYEYFLGKFAQAEGKLGGEFYTPRCVVRVLVEMLEPYEGRVYDPCCGSGGMFVQSERFVEAHGGRRTDISIFGQESNPTTWRLAHMNVALRGIEANLGEKPADTFLANLHPDLRCDYLLANPPFNVSDWSGQLLRDDVRWKYGAPPVGNANYAWIQHFVHHLAVPNGKGGGVAGFVMANGSLSSNSGGEGDIRRSIVEADLVDCIVALPAQLFYTTGIPVCLWFLTRDKTGRNLRNGCPNRPRAVRARRCSSTPASSARCRRGRCASYRARRTPSCSRDRTTRGPTPILAASPTHSASGAASRRRSGGTRPQSQRVGTASGSTPTAPASARRRRSTTSRSTATSSRRAATSAPRMSRTTASRSRRSTRGWWRRLKSILR
ncbi:type I restriction-modification system subunit M [Botrimarina mediterranea]|uniref:site-specific DNA-methyltransferase (adenine-specific) n=1 Tax=Botrimarina mediterranea TaxID=2528022 RepID=A0A518K917_9BACT|nr:class I SAM-dependent DNA methyltransferase [Botrimarina mediterranea]QDV74292.1 Type I restriction enzyme EcoKI M protein [Botrimarina mediterranea]